MLSTLMKPSTGDEEGLDGNCFIVYLISGAI